RPVLGTGEVGREAAREHDIRPADPAAHRDGRRARRTLGPLRRMARRGDGAGVRMRGSRRRGMSEPTAITLHTADGLALEGEFATGSGTPAAAVVLCHPHPQYGS